MYAMTGSLVEAEDLVQEAFARAWRNWDKVSGYADPEAWVRSVACRVRVSVWRKAVNRVTAHRRLGMPEEVPTVAARLSESADAGAVSGRRHPAAVACGEPAVRRTSGPSRRRPARRGRGRTR